MTALPWRGVIAASYNAWQPMSTASQLQGLRTETCQAAIVTAAKGRPTLVLDLVVADVQHQQAQAAANNFGELQSTLRPDAVVR